MTAKNYIFVRYALIIVVLYGLKGKQVNCITEDEEFLLLVIWACVIWVWFDCLWKDGYKILEWLFRPGSKSSCAHSWEMLEETEQAQSVPLLSETSRCRQVEPGSACSKKKVLYSFTLFETRGQQRGIIPAMLSRASSHVLFLADYKPGFTKCKDWHTKSDHLPIILLLPEAIRERSTSLTQSQKLSGQSVLNKVLHWKR